MATYKELLEQQQQLEQAIAAARKSELSQAVKQVQAIISEYGLTNDDIFGRVRAAKSGSVAPKYRDPATGATWTGRGKAPKWIDGKNRDEFAIPA